MKPYSGIFYTCFLILVSVIGVSLSSAVPAVAEALNPRQQVNSISAFLDGSVIYGSDATRAAALRTFVGGKLKTSANNLPPQNSEGLANANDAHIVPDNQLYLFGDVRGNENIELTAVQALFVREHNRLADAFLKKFPNLSDEAIYHRSRAIVIAELQVITYKEFLPALLGPNALKTYSGYKSNVNPGIANEFSTAAYRVGHTMINDDVEFLDNDAKPVRDEIPLAQAFFNPSWITQTGIDPVLKYLATDNAQEVDPKIVDGLRNFLFGPPGAGGFDLIARNIQRGRDHGLADYNTTRQSYGLPAVTSFSGITKNIDLQNKLQTLYGTVNNIDLLVGGISEDHVSGGSIGPTFTRIIADQFERLRDGDRFWYQRFFADNKLMLLEQTRLSDIIRRNTTITKLQQNVFLFDASSTVMLPVGSDTLLPRLIQLFGQPLTEVRTYDGSENNPTNPLWGSAGSTLLRMSANGYLDGLSVPAGSTRPSARLISNVLAAQDQDIRNDRKMSDWVYAWGQFIDHDLDLTKSGSTPFNIAIPTNDPYFDPSNTGTQVMSLKRSIFDPATGF